MTAVGGSVILHVLIVAWVLSHGVTPKIMPQQLITVTMIAMPAADYIEKKSEPTPQHVVKKSTPQHQKIKPVPSVNPPAPEKKPASAVMPQETTSAATSDLQQLLAINDSAANNNAETASAPQSAQQATTAPVFDADTLNNPVPDYPALAKRRGIEGTVLLGVQVTAEGVAKSVTVIKTSGFSMLDRAAQEAVVRWKFVPARKGNDPVEASVIVPIEFRLA